MKRKYIAKQIPKFKFPIPKLFFVWNLRFGIWNFTPFIYAIIFFANNLYAQNIGYYNAPYVRYEADDGTLASGASVTTRSYNQANLQSEASEQVCVNLSSAGASVQWTVSAAGDGLVIRYSVPDGQSGTLDVYANGTFAATLTLGSYYSWQHLESDPNPNNNGVTNTNWKMRFDEIRYKLSSQIPAGGTLRLVRNTGNIHIDFAELEPVPAAIPSTGNVYTGNGSDLQTYIDARGGQTIFLPAGVYNVNRDLFFGVNNTVLRGAGMWYTQINFTSATANDGGLWAQASNISFSDLYLTTNRNARSNNYKALNGVYTNGSTITRIWAEHFECGAWIAQYGVGPAYADAFTMSHCRFRNNYADGTNLCKGTRNAIVEHCNFRNNGDDDMAIWSADGLECQNNTFRYNTSENCWRASGCAIYGGLSNKAHNLLIKDNLEVGLRVNNSFPGVQFNTSGMHEFYNIAIYRCGTNHDLYYSPVGAIDIKVTNVSGTRVRNVKFSCINIVDSKNDAIYIYKTNGTGFDNLIFENITINGTGREYPDNGGTGTARGHFVLFKGSPDGTATHCNMSYSNRGGNATVDVNTTEKGTLTWSIAGSCPTGCVLPTEISSSSTTITSAITFGVCDNPITLTATTTAPSGNTVSNIEFFVDNVSIGSDNSSPYSMGWNNPTVGNHTVKAVATYSGGTTSTSAIQNVTVADGIYSTATPPAIDGSIDALWSNYAAFPLTKIPVGSISGPADLSATFQVTRDATNLYILVNVTDDILRNDGALSWEKDGLELFIDMGNDKGTTYGPNDYQYSFVWNVNTPQAGLTFAQTTKAGNLGYIMEIRIPWTTLGGVPATGTFMGFDLHVNDDDNGGTRDAKITWNDAVDIAWQNPSVFGTLQIAGCSNPLPVELLTFTGEVKNGTAVLNWATVAEINNEKFIIERSGDLSDWEAIGEVVGAGNLTYIINYSFTDFAPLDDIIYYRLRQVDFDGAFAYSNIVALETDAHNNISIMPNPFDDALTIESNIKGNINISIHDALGKLLFHLNQESNNGILSISPDLSSGAYLITIQTEAFIEQRKIIKK